MDPQVGRTTPQQHYSATLCAFIAEAPLERQSIAEFVAAAAASLPAGSLVADVGAGSAPFREFFDHVDYLTVDRAESLHGDVSDFDIIASAEAIPLDDESLDAILCTQVLEHLPDPADALDELFRLLRPGGRLFLTAPLVWEEHEKPHDFFRYTRSGLEHLLTGAGFEQIEISGHTDSFTTLAQLLHNARWSLGAAGDESDKLRHAAFQRLDEIADELLTLAPLDARHAFPLGYKVIAARPVRRADSSAYGRRKDRPARVDDSRTPILYLAPWVDLGGSDKGTIDWFKHIDRSRWAPSIITTQPSANRWLPELELYAEEIWPLADLMPGLDFPAFILGFIETRDIKLVHIMNSRLGFDLMPDMRCLADPPVVVVQLHAEEHDRSGYVRYVTSRYGNLVDAFSVTSQQLADAMADYDIPSSRLYVIPTGVDGLDEFNPDRVVPLDPMGDSCPQILWPGRLVAQKDPMLTLDVIKALDSRGLPFVLDVVGDGELKNDLVDRARELGIDHRIRWHAPSHEMPRWYRSSDLLLMTSTFEGVPYVIYEALAMGVPVVAPALPGNIELMGTDGGALIDPRDNITAYADAIQSLLLDGQLRREVGRTARRRMLSDFPLSKMGQQHDLLYEHLLSNRLQSSQAKSGTEPRATPQPADDPVPISLPRDLPRERSVAVIMPCYQHGRFLPDAIRSLHEQTLLPRRIIVVDDASADPETAMALDVLDQDPRVTVIRLPINLGPSAARNRALAEINENYVLPLDADDMLDPYALEEMVNLLEKAPATIGFVYPNVRHFGNRNDSYGAPAYNLNILLRDNYCVSASLFDSRVFNAGIRYAEDIVSGHEDWDLVLQLAEHGVYGQIAEGATLLYRKQGFSRVNAVEYGPRSFHEHIERRHPRLFNRDRDRVKAEWSPALTLVLADGSGGSANNWPEHVTESLRAQTCSDFETICVGHELVDPDPLQTCKIASLRTESLEAAIHSTRGRFVLAANASVADGLRRSTFVEQIIRLFWSNVTLTRLVIATVSGRQGPRLALLTESEAARAIPCAVAWRRQLDVSSEVIVGDAGDFLEDIILHWQVEGPITWRTV